MGGLAENTLSGSMSKTLARGSTRPAALGLYQASCPGVSERHHLPSLMLLKCDPFNRFVFIRVLHMCAVNK